MRVGAASLNYMSMHCYVSVFNHYLVDVLTYVYIRTWPYIQYHTILKLTCNCIRTYMYIAQTLLYYLHAFSVFLSRMYFHGNQLQRRYSDTA